MNNINQTNLNSININRNLDILSEPNNINASNELLNKDNSKNDLSIQTFKKDDKKNSKANQEEIKDKSIGNIYSNNIIQKEAANNIQELNLNYVNNFCYIY